MHFHKKLFTRMYSKRHILLPKKKKWYTHACMWRGNSRMHIKMLWVDTPRDWERARDWRRSELLLLILCISCSKKMFAWGGYHFYNHQTLKNNLLCTWSVQGENIDVLEQCGSSIRVPKCVWMQEVINNNVWVINTGIRIASDL